MRKVALAAIALSTVAGIAAAWWWRPPEAPVPAPSAPVDHSSDSKDDAAAIAASKGLAWRDGNGLSLRLKSGEILTLADRVTCGDLPCPPELSARYRYLGWNETSGGYDLQIAPSPAPKSFLPFADDEAALLDARHVERSADAPVALPPQPPAVQTDDSLSEWLTDIANGRNQGEAPLILASHDQALRDGARLTLKLVDGKTLTLTDDLICGQVACPQQVFRSFDYGGLSSDGRFHVVEEHWNEANAGLLISTRTGGVTFLLGLPKFSPDAKRAVASVTDLEWSAPRRLEIWSLAGAVPGIEYSLPAKDEDDTIYEVVGWADAEHVRLRRGPWASEQRSPAMLAHGGNGWHLESSEGTN
ncbi:hypothetical protein [Telmatospirillum sp.]|uniref:hypothetical protein n=1 Tax=Telmatospirillum sp. TaxID=2079197 RepID=UPI00283C7C12|nr:hypothetical protein [Telmatospirillum sp.]MDR3438500.1 hypothetical protein [Telmatospirillum sp.]